MSSIGRNQLRDLDLSKHDHLPIEAPSPSAPHRALLWVFASFLVAATLAACSESDPLPIEKPALVEPARHVVNLTNKGPRLDNNPVAVMAENREPAVTAEPVVTTEPVAETKPAHPQKTLQGFASYYSRGQKTASGEMFNERGMTAAHRTLPFGTRVRVTSLESGRSVTVRINDRGPYVNGRIVDVSRAAAESIGMIDRGVTKVKLEVVQ
jgi:rare lipoprotein A